MKILCCCAGGNWRSHHLALILKDCFHQDAIACGLATSQGDDTLEMLYNWADKIIVMTNEVKDNVPEQWRYKMEVWEVGQDNYNHTVSSALMREIIKHIDAQPELFGEDRTPGWIEKWRSTVGDD